jgi:hypothetical protein
MKAIAMLGILAGVFLMTSMVGAAAINVYEVPAKVELEIGDTTHILLRCDTTERISGWGIEFLNFTKDVISVDKVELGDMFKDNETMSGKGVIHNETGVVGGSWKDYFWQAIAESGWINNTNRTMLNITVHAEGAGKGQISIYSSGNQYFGFAGIPLEMVYHPVDIKVRPKGPENFSASQDNDLTRFNLTKGDGADFTIIRGKLGSYPEDINDGTWGINQYAVSFNATLSNGYWYFGAWSYNETADAYSSIGAVAELNVSYQAKYPGIQNPMNIMVFVISAIIAIILIVGVVIWKRKKPIQ